MAYSALTRNRRAASNLHWGLLMVLGLMGVAAGVVVLAKPDNSLKVLAVVTGIFLILDGIFEVVVSLEAKTENRGLAAMLGAFCLIFGIALVRQPIKGVTAVALIIGVWLVAMGLVRLVGAFESAEHRGVRVVVALIELTAGTVIAASPDIGFATLALITGIAFILNGIGLFALGWVIRGAEHAADALRPGAGAAV
jgi:uncharacterized membrane protein HdeD (DUF308 family)